MINTTIPHKGGMPTIFTIVLIWLKPVGVFFSHIERIAKEYLKIANFRHATYRVQHFLECIHAVCIALIN